MALERSARPLARCMRCTRHDRIISRSISSSPWRAQEETTTTETSSAPPPPPPQPAETKSSPVEKRPNPELVSNPRRERRMIRDHSTYPIGSRRRRAALASSANIPFEQLPYQCLQEARKVIQADRADKVAEIEELRGKIMKWTATEVPPERERIKELRLQSWTREIERLKILADSNDPLVKKKFEDGVGDMNKPIYRHLADLKWRSHEREILVQRITQMNVVPDVLPAIDPKASVNLSFRGSKVPHGDFVFASNSEKPPTLRIQSYEKGTKLVTIAVVTPDVPNVKKDGYDYRCHFLAANVMISPTRTNVDLGSLSKKASVIQDWLPPYSQKGAPYQRLAVVVLEQPSRVPEPEVAAVDEGTDGKSGGIQTKPADTAAVEPSIIQEGTPETATTESTIAKSVGSVEETSSKQSNTLFSVPTTTASTITAAPHHERLPIAAIKSDSRYTKRQNFILLSFATKYRLKAIGVDLFRTQWDETTADVMQRNGIVGHDIEFKRKRVDPLPYQRLKGERFR